MFATLPSRGWRPVLVLAVLLLAVAWAGTSGAPPADKEQEDPAVQKFAERAAEKGSDLNQLRQEILSFLRRKAGTPAGIQAARLLAKLPSPLDTLDSKSIPPLDRFDWQPKELVAVVGEHRGRQGHVVNAIAYSKKGKWVASAGANGYVRIWDPATLRQQARVSTGSSSLCVAFSPDEKFVAAGNASGGLYMWNLSGKEPMAAGAFRIATSPVYSVDFSPDGKVLAAGAYDGLVHLFDTTGDKAKTRTQLAGHKTGVRAVRFTPSGKNLASASTDGIIRFWAIGKETIEERTQVESHPKSGGVTSLAFAPSGTILAAGHGDGTVAFWGIGNRVVRRGQPFKAQVGEVKTLIYSRSGSLLTCGTEAARIWDPSRPTRPRATIDGHDGAVHGADFSPDGRSVVTGGADWTVRLWTFGSRGPIEKFPLKGHLSSTAGVAFSPNDRILATGSYDRTARTWDVTKVIPTQMKQMTCDAHVSTLAYAPDGKTFATAGASTAAALWDAARGTKVHNLAGHPSHVNKLAFTLDGTRLLASSDKVLVMWNPSTGREIYRFTEHEQRINSFSLSRDGRYALTGTGYYEYDARGAIVTKDGEYQYLDCTLRLINLEDSEVVKTEKKLKYPVSSVSFTPDGRGAVCSLWRSNTHLWAISPQTFKDQGELPTTAGWAHQHVFAPDGRTLATIGNSHQLILFDVPSGKVTWKWTPQEYVSGLDFSADGRYLAISLYTGPVYILRLKDAPQRVSQ